MQQKESEAQARKEFFNEMERRFADKIVAVEMVCIEADEETFALLELKPTHKHAPLWGLLIIGEKDLHFYAHPVESAFLGLFRTVSNGKPPSEQSFSFRVFKERRLGLAEKRTLFGKKHDPYRLTFNARMEDGSTISFYLHTHNKAEYILEKCRL